MVIKDFIQLFPDDYDAYDNVFDMSVTCCDIYPLEEEQKEDWYYKVCDRIYSEVDVLDWPNDRSSITADWTGYINRKKAKFEAFMREHWETQYEDEDDFLEQWIREIHLFLAGYGNDDIYKNFYEGVLA